MDDAERAAGEETIVAISTPPGRGGIGIVRLSGGRAREIAEPMVRLRHGLEPGRARFGELVDAAGERLDEAVVTWFAAPHSYTSEDVVEMAAHGSPVLLDDLLRRCVAAGARLAEPGEFTQRAFLAGRLDLTQAEAVRDLIAASTLEQARAAARQLGGSLAREIAPAKRELIGLIAALEAGIDFAEDDIDTLERPAIGVKIAEVRRPLDTLARTFAYGRVLRDGLRLAIVGRPNAGKSSLFNRLVERERAIVTASPGTTRDLVAERVSLDGIPVELMDTAGLRDAVDEAEAMGVARSREAMAEADVVLLVIDAAAGVHAEDEAVIAGLTGRPLLIAANKADLRAAMSVEGVPGRVVVETSALTGAGVAELRRAVVEMVAGQAAAEGPMVTNLRQQQALEAAVRGLTRAGEAAAQGIPHEMLLLDLYEALAALDTLTGSTTSEDILNLIFSSFCIGK